MIRVVKYNPQWPDIFRAIASQIELALADIPHWIEHVGSTSVPDLSAKPIIDMDIVVPEDVYKTAIIRNLENIGYVHRGNFGIEGREAFDAPEALPGHNLYLCSKGSLPLRNHLAVRDYLRVNPRFRDRYSELKLALARQFPDDIDSYVEGKTGFLTEILLLCDFSEDEIHEITAVNKKPG